ncbi:hypothetical protein [Alloprevotella sp. OH1205_COT-284]|nr:hypothetical protein [Alloprevotella sp. OH1205_COT-284]
MTFDIFRPTDAEKSLLPPARKFHAPLLLPLQARREGGESMPRSKNHQKW